ncbi:hypothetical protein V8G54_011140 [Vigna mungo]|uniref:Chaperone DnaJ C-terminal domain-containing protein n=1 Tax=Vigna mungo TaxID=3915 RepID=A0AAQ3NNI4_VIGMU
MNSFDFSELALDIYRKSNLIAILQNGDYQGLVVVCIGTLTLPKLSPSSPYSSSSTQPLSFVPPFPIFVKIFFNRCVFLVHSTLYFDFVKQSALFSIPSSSRVLGVPSRRCSIPSLKATKVSVEVVLAFLVFRLCGGVRVRASRGFTSGIGLEIARQRKLVEEVFLVQLQPGWKKGTKLMYLEKGYELENHRLADLVLFIYEELHRVYTRDGDDLETTKRSSAAKNDDASNVGNVVDSPDDDGGEEFAGVGGCAPGFPVPHQLKGGKYGFGFPLEKKKKP